MHICGPHSARAHLREEVGHELVVVADGLALHRRRLLALDEADEVDVVDDVETLMKSMKSNLREKSLSLFILFN